MSMNVAKGYIKHPITKEMMKPCEMYQTETDENTEVQQIEESEEK